MADSGDAGAPARMPAMNPAEWVTVREHLEKLFQEERAGHDRYHAVTEGAHRREHETMSEAMRLARDIIDGKMEQLNKLRGEVVEDRALLIRRDVCQTQMDAIITRVDAIEKAEDIRWGEVQGARGYARNLVGLVALGLAVLEFVLRFIVR